MSKPKLTNLANDIFDRVLKGSEVEQDVLADYGISAGKSLRKLLVARPGSRYPKTLFANEIGKPCLRQAWFRHNTPGLGETIPGYARVKFHYGDVLESLVLSLAKAAGHEVSHEQHKISQPVMGTDWVVNGRVDAVIDGELVDVKSTSGVAYSKFLRSDWPEKDDFGYYDQVNTYAVALGFSGFRLVLINKENGQIGLTNKVKADPMRFTDKAMQLVSVVSDPATCPPQPPWAVVAPPKSLVGMYPASTWGALSTACSYCDFKNHCWKDANCGVGPLPKTLPSGRPYFMINLEKA